jgi:hypothetical protein
MGQEPVSGEGEAEVIGDSPFADASAFAEASVDESEDKC